MAIQNPRLFPLKRVGGDYNVYQIDFSGPAPTMTDFTTANVAAGGYQWEEIDVDPIGGTGHKLKMAHITGDEAGLPSSEPSKGPVLLLHNMTGNSADWFANTPAGELPLPYRLFQDGYDVYLGDFRGTTASQDHTTSGLIDSDSASYWNFDMQDLGEGDVTAMVSSILQDQDSCMKVAILTDGESAPIPLYTLAGFPTASSERISSVVNRMPKYFRDFAF